MEMERCALLIPSGVLAAFQWSDIGSQRLIDLLVADTTQILLTLSPLKPYDVADRNTAPCSRSFEVDLN